jgi:DNA-binding transcriptional LysR family regulator
MFSLTAHHLQVFLTAAETLNFTQAAQKLQISQPSVSQQIQSLEEHFGASLFARSNRNIELTEAGTILLPLAREVIFLCTHVEETMASLKGDVYGHLVVGCSTSTGRYLLPQLLASFHRMHTQVRATCKIVSPHHAVQLLSEGSIHLCLTSDPPPIEDIEFRKLTTENLVLIAHPDHPWAGKGDIEPGSLYHADFILPEDGTEAHGSIREALACAGISIYKLNTLVSLGSPEAIALAVQEGLGVGFVPELIVNKLVNGRVTRIQVNGLNIYRTIFLGRNRTRPSTSAQSAFWDMFSTLEESVAFFGN